MFVLGSRSSPHVTLRSTLLYFNGLVQRFAGPDSGVAPRGSSGVPNQRPRTQLLERRPQPEGALVEAIN